MKIWLLTTEYPPFFGGGIATYCFHTAHMFASFGHEVSVFVADSNLEKSISIETIENIRVIKFRPGLIETYKYLGYVAALSFQFSEIVEEFIKQEGAPDVLECQDYLGIAYFLLQKKKVLWDKLTDLPIVLTLHTPKFLCDIHDQAPVYRFPDYWIGEMERFCIRAADAVISPSRYLIDELSKYIDLTKLKTYIIPNPYETSNDKSLISWQESDREDLIFLGRLQYLKGILHLFRYFRELWDNGVNIRLKLVGGDTFFYPKSQTMSSYLQKKYRRYFEDGLVTWEGKKDPETLMQMLRKVRIGIVPSLIESFSYTVVELLSQGVMVIASDSGGHREIIEDGKSGFIFSHQNPESFKSKLLKAMELSPEKMEEMAENARKRLYELCSYEAVYNKKIKVLEELTHTKNCSRIFPFIRESQVEPQDKVQQKELFTEAQEEKDLLSIVIPYYNMGDYIKDTLDSLLRISYPQKEIIVVNDGSDEPKSLAILYQIEKNYPVRVIHKRNGGLATARNEGALNARGEFLAFLDADDLVSAEYYDWAIKILKYYSNVSFIGCWTEYFGAARGIWPTWNPEPPYLLVHNTLNSSGLVFRKRDFLLYGLNDPEMEYGMEDYECVIRMVKNGCRGVIIPRPFFKYRVRPDSMSRQFNRGNMLYLYNLISQKHADFYGKYAKDVFNLLNANGPGYLYDNPTWELPPIGFVSKGTENEIVGSLDWSTHEIPPELKEKLLSLWRRPFFRRALRLFFRLRLDKLF
ncbi:glycosyltransferase [Thermosediminibacter oceani]|uniref:Glycosyl transferase family 2 n=1 Tax=Thermosediminibacter oceani (strain ATCC BAA-1034 / DSM 16646 / JW/IW-1228P) TaxID=555079 RepID=D9S1J0_THEOJ|nr:glycosyltransferase [Thermosediminibacter oceani]ADL07267.1 glycosyl transferase family 2 [Thermosediminibacter oceani DSM 16646]